MNQNILNLVLNKMKAIIKKTGKSIEVEKVPVYVDELTSYFVYENINTHEQYKYSELKFENK